MSEIKQDLTILEPTTGELPSLFLFLHDERKNPLMGWIQTPEVKPEMAFSKEELEDVRARISPEDKAEFDKLTAEGWTPFKPVFVESEAGQTEQAQLSQQTQAETKPVEQEQIEKRWEASDGTPGKAAEPQRR